MPASRDIVISRRALSDTIGNAFLPIEERSIAVAAEAQRCVATLIEQHRAAALPLELGNDAIELVNEGAQLLLAGRDRFLKAHAKMAQVARELGDSVSAFSPDCPENVFWGGSPRLLDAG